MSRVEDTCPHCGAVVRPDAPWCTLCLTDLRPAPAPVPEPVPEPVPVAVAAPVPEPVPASVPASVPESVPESVAAASVALETPVRRRGRHARGADDDVATALPMLPDADLDDATAAAPGRPEESVDVMLSLLRAEHARDDSVPFADVMSERSTRVMVIVGGMVALTVLGLFVLFVLGHVF